MKAKRYNCPAEMTLTLISGKWKIIILWLLRKGPQRSGKLKSRLPGISAAAFSNAVRALEEGDIIKRVMKSSAPLEVSYVLTPTGESLTPIVKSLVKWGLAHQDPYLLGEFSMAKFYRT